MARKASELAEIAAAKLQTAKDEIIATCDYETIAWALDLFRQTDELLRRVMADCDAPSGARGGIRGRVKTEWGLRDQTGGTSRTEKIKTFLIKYLRRF
jgi:hypothetical protein